MSNDEVIHSVEIGINGSETTYQIYLPQVVVCQKLEAQEWYAADLEQPYRFSFTGQACIIFNLELNSSELQYFETFFDDQLIL